MWGTDDREGHDDRGMKLCTENADTQLAFSFLCIQSGTPAYGMVSHTFRVGLMFSVKPL